MTAPTLTDDLANVLTLVQRVFVGQPDVRCEIARVLDRYADENQCRFDLSPESAPTDPAGEYLTQIVYDRETHDYAMYLDGECVGMARTMHEADVTLSQLILELKAGQYFIEAA